MNKRMNALIGRLEHKKNLKSSYYLSLPEIYLLLNQLLNSDKNAQGSDTTESQSIEEPLVNNSEEALTECKGDLIEAMDRYISFLSNAYNQAYGIANIHHFRAKEEDIQKGVELRNEIERLKRIKLPSPAVGGMSAEHVTKFVRFLNSDYMPYAYGWVKKYGFKRPEEKDIKTTEQLYAQWEESASPAVKDYTQTWEEAMADDFQVPNSVKLKDDWKERLREFINDLYSEGDGYLWDAGKEKVINWIETNLKP